MMNKDDVVIFKLLDTGYRLAWFFEEIYDNVLFILKGFVIF